MRMSRRHFFPAMLVGFAIFIGSIRPVSGIELSKEEQAYLHKNNTIVFVSQTRYSPFEFVDKNGDHTGMSIELARWMATKLGFKPEFTDTFFKQAQRDVLSGKADVLTSFFYSKKRDELFDFTQVVFDVPASIFVAAERPDIKDIQDLNGKRIAMQTGDYAEEFLKSKNVEFDVVTTKNFAEATDLVISGKADALIGDEQIVLYHIFKNNLVEEIKKVGEPLYVGRNCMATRGGNALLAGILDKGIKAARKDGIIDKINRKWIGTYASRESSLSGYLPHLFIAAGVIAVLALLLWFWNIRLRFAVKMRTRELSARDAIQTAVVFALERFSDACFTEEEGFQNILEQLGKATDASRVYLFENGVNKTGELVTNQRSEWMGKEVASQSGNPGLQNLSYKNAGIERWIGILGRGQIIEGNVRDFPESEQDILRPQDILSILVVPVMVENRWWGFLGFDECRLERNWSVAEVEALKAAGRILGGLMQWKRTEDKLKISHERFRRVLDSLDATVYVADMETYELLFINQRMRDLFGNVEGQICWKSIRDDQSGPCDFCTNENLLDDNGRPKGLVVWETWNPKAGGWFEIRDQAIQWIDGRIVRLEITSNIDDRKESEMALQESEDRFSTMFEHISSGAAVYEPTDNGEDFIFRAFNRAAEGITRVSQQEALGNRLLDLFPYMNKSGLLSALQRVWKTGEAEHLPPFYYKDEKREGWRENRIYKLPSGEVVALFDDVTERMRAEEQMAASLKEKEVLLREIHHRSKNNMQVMISLLKIQCANIEDKQVAEMFKESRDRIRSMALVHEKLYQSKGLADVDFKGYVKSLVSSIFSSYGANAAGITPITETDDVSIGLETAIPCGLIINELVSNSLKYAFPGNKKGEIRVALRSFDEDALVLEVGDNGIGMPEDLDFRNTASMGLHLVNILSEDQLHGKIELDRAGGTTFRIRFKNHKYEARI